MDEFFKAIAAESKLSENIARQLTDVGYVVIEGPVAHNKPFELPGGHAPHVSRPEFSRMSWNFGIGVNAKNS